MEASPIRMVDLAAQYRRLSAEILPAIEEVLESTQFVKGPQVKAFEQALSAYHGEGVFTVSCGNGTDALQIALMALELPLGSEVILPAFTYTATAEVLLLLGLVPVFADVHPDTFVLDPASVESLITGRTRLIMPVHLFGQCAPMEELQNIAKQHGLLILEDNAQSIGADYAFSSGPLLRAGTLGDLSATSFFPSKNLGAYGDGGAITTRNPELAERCRQIANHGQSALYLHERVGVNSRLDSIQAAILLVKLRHLDQFTASRRQAAARYRKLLQGIPGLELPALAPRSTHVYHQFCVKVSESERDALKHALQQAGIPSMVYYPMPLYRQPAYQAFSSAAEHCPVSEQICKQVLALPMHSELNEQMQVDIASAIIDYFKIATL
jgi:UDP-2-acetamido-2-deoxy-ribo-hexuluronate aminotransferase